MKLWRSDIEDDIYKLNPLNDSMIKEAEELLNVKLPDVYLDILREQNGGYIEFNAHPCPSNDAVEGNSIDINHIMGIGKPNGILDSLDLIQEWELPKDIVLLGGDGHSWIAFDYRYKKENPPLLWIDVESNVLVEIADSFNHFLNQLYTEEVVFEFDSSGTVQISNEDLSNAIRENNVFGIIESLDLLPFEIDERTIGWFSEALLNLSNHPNSEVRRSVSQATHSLVDMLDRETLAVLAEKFMNDFDSDVQYFGSRINEKL
ncbi:SMI1/KNR4 family protein [Lysinibacillus yapensis]|uniref:SMI1/KNR4 family protein n=1 Tax=Ureibacillus yapensis TaxID=2304605 RepID=A0A396SA73_9BACL|nr:SMI1/KNR4 family protein [Lysinibacillus yapensis]RHW30918.1 SMI1/KNR4 family protein [Lysinibacillus yapensis]